MGRDDKKRDGVTIVGGRPMHRAVEVTDLPIGLEQALTVAALNYRFRDALRRNPVAAATAIGIRLDDAEVALMRTVSADRLADMARRMIPAPDASRRRFVKNAAASVVAMIAGKAFLLCSGCTGADTWGPMDDYTRAGNEDTRRPREIPDPVQKMATLASHICYLYVPGKVLSRRGQPAPVLLALHDEGEMCISNVQRWSAAADNYGFSIVSVNWTEEPKSAEDLEQLAVDLKEILLQFGMEYPRDQARCYLASRGASTPIAFKAAFENHSGLWAAATFLGGVPMEGCIYGLDVEVPFPLVEQPPALYYVVGQADPDFNQQNLCLEMFSFYDIDLKVEWLTGTTDQAQLHFSTIWDWMAQYEGGGLRG